MTTLHEELKVLHERMQNPENWDAVGICGTLIEFNLDDEFLRLAKKWKEHSGRYSFPVPTQNKSPEIAYLACWLSIDEQKPYMWDRKTSPYAAARWRLLEWAIEQTKPE